MPFFAIGPSGAGASTQWTLSAGGSNYTAMAASDGFTSYIRGDGAEYDSYICTNLPGDASGVTDSVTHTIVCADGLGTGSQTISHFIRSAGINYNFGNTTIVPADGQLYTFQKTQTGTAVLGTPWTVALLNGLEIGVLAGATGGGRVLATYVALTGTYSTTGGGGGGGGSFVLIMSLVASMIGAGLALHEMPAVSRAASLAQVGQSRQLRLLPSEYRPAWEAWRANKHRTYSL